MIRCGRRLRKQRVSRRAGKQDFSAQYQVLPKVKDFRLVPPQPTRTTLSGSWIVGIIICSIY